MSEYIKRLAQSAVRFTGQPSAISPQLEDYNRIPNIRRPMEGDATRYRIILYVGYIDLSDIAITFPKQHVMVVAVKHGIKAIDALSHRLSKVAEVPQVIRDTHCPLMCSREDVCFFSLPSNVKKSSLTAHMSQDGFLVIQSRMLSVDDVGITGFDMKRLIVIKVCRDLKPSLSSVDCRTMALSLIEQAATLASNVMDTLRPDGEDNAEDASGRGEASQSEVVISEGDEVSRSEDGRDRVVRRESGSFRGIVSLRDLSRVVVEDSRRDGGATNPTRHRELAEDESRDRSQIESSFTVVRRKQQSEVPDPAGSDYPKDYSFKHSPQKPSGPSRRDSRDTGDGMRFKAIDMMVRKEGSPKIKDTKEKSCEPSTSTRRDSSGSAGQSSDKPEHPSKESKSLDETSGAKSSKIAEKSSAEIRLSKEKSTERKIAAEVEPETEKISEAKDSSEAKKTVESKEPDAAEKARESKGPSDEKASDSKDTGVEEKDPDSKEPDVEEKTSQSKDPDVEEKVPDSKETVDEYKVSESEDPDVEEKEATIQEPVVEEATEGKEPGDKEKVSESKELSVEKASDSKDPDVEDKTPESKETVDKEKVSETKKPTDEKVSESKGPSLKKKGTSSAKASSEKKPSPEKSAEGEISPKKEPSPEKDTKTEGKSDSKDPSPAKGVKEESSPKKESSQLPRTTRRETLDKVSQRDPQNGKEKKVATKSLPLRSTRSVVASLAAPQKPPASPSKVGRSKVKTEEAPGTPSKRSGKGKPKDTDASKR